ncbi:MAG TPA: hypothetical protein VFG11_09410, partial [Acidobacteriota bacterium]|nr:hypothetical protein [Acidobacteriota bacterium]
AKSEARAKSEDIDALYQRWIKQQHGDEDIGPGTLDALMKTITAINPELSNTDADEVLKQLQEIIKN